MLFFAYYYASSVSSKKLCGNNRAMRFLVCVASVAHTFLFGGSKKNDEKTFGMLAYRGDARIFTCGLRKEERAEKQ